LVANPKQLDPELKRENAEPREEIARFRASGMEDGTSPKRGGKGSGKRPSGEIVPRDSDRGGGATGHSVQGDTKGFRQLLMTRDSSRPAANDWLCRQASTNPGVLRVRSFGAYYRVSRMTGSEPLPPERCA